MGGKDKLPSSGDGLADFEHHGKGTAELLIDIEVGGLCGIIEKADTKFLRVLRREAAADQADDEHQQSHATNFLLANFRL